MKIYGFLFLIVIIGVVFIFQNCSKFEAKEPMKITAGTGFVNEGSYKSTDSFLWGTEAGEFYIYPWQTAQISNQTTVITNILKINLVKFRLQIKLEHKLIETEDFSSKICPQNDNNCFDTDEIVKTFKQNNWSMVPMLSGLFLDGTITDNDIETYVNFVDWFVSRYNIDANITMIELQNAPQDWWPGTGEQLVKACNKIYERIKSKNSNILVGTPGFEYSIDEEASLLKENGGKESFERVFLEKGNNPKFDFWAFHGYPLMYANFTEKSVFIYPPTKTALNNKYGGISGIIEIRKKLNENGWQERMIIDTEHVGTAEIGPVFSKKDDNFDTAYLLQELILKRTLQLNGSTILSGIIPLKIVPRGQGGEYQWGSLNSDGSTTKNVRAVANLISLIKEKYKYVSRISGAFDDENTPWIEKFLSKEQSELYVYFKPFKYPGNEMPLNFDDTKLTYQLDLEKIPSEILLTDPTKEETSSLALTQSISIEVSNTPKFLEIKFQK